MVTLAQAPLGSRAVIPLQATPTATPQADALSLDVGTLTGMAEAEWNVERHLLGKPPEVVALYHHFTRLVSACGPFTYSVSKSAITCKGTRRGFAGARLRHHALGGYLDLQRRVEDPRIIRSSPYTSRLYVHQFRIETASQLDDEFAGWIHEAYQVGGGQPGLRWTAHVTAPRATVAGSIDLLAARYPACRRGRGAGRK